MTKRTPDYVGQSCSKGCCHRLSPADPDATMGELRPGVLVKEMHLFLPPGELPFVTLRLAFTHQPEAVGSYSLPLINPGSLEGLPAECQEPFEILLTGSCPYCADLFYNGSYGSDGCHAHGGLFAEWPTREDDEAFEESVGYTRPPHLELVH